MKTVELLGVEVPVSVRKTKTRTELVIHRSGAELLPPALVARCRLAGLIEEGKVTIADTKGNYVIFEPKRIKVNVSGDEKDAIAFVERVIAKIIVALDSGGGQQEGRQA